MAEWEYVGPQEQSAPADGGWEYVGPPEMSWGTALKKGVKNLPGSVGQYYADTANTFLHPVQTGAQLGQAVVENPQAVGQELIRPYTSAAEFKNTIAEDPARIMGDFAMVGGVGGAAIPGKIGRAATAASRAADPLVWAGKGAKVAGQGLGGMSGAGARMPQEAYSAMRQGGKPAQAFMDNYRGVAPKEDVVIAYRKALDESKKRMSLQYRTNKAGAFSAARNEIPFKRIYAGVRRAEKFRRYKGQSLKSPEAEATLGKIKAIVTDWGALDPKEFHTPEGLDALKQKIYSTVDYESLSGEQRAIVDDVTRPISGLIRKSAPQYAKMMDDYQKAKKAEKNLVDAFSSGKNIDSALRKLQSSLRDNAYAGHGFRAQLMNDLRKNHPEIAAAVSGQAANAIIPRGIHGLASPFQLMGAGASMFYAPWMAAPIAGLMLGTSPKVLGGASAAAGYAARYPGMAMDALGVTPRGVGLGAMLGSRTNRELEDN